MAKKFLHRYIGTHARVYVHFLRKVCMHLDRCFNHHACAGVYVKQMLCASAYTFAYTLATGCAYGLMYVSALGNEGGRVQLVYEGTSCLAWGAIFDKRRDRRVVGVFSNLIAGGRYVGVCVYIRTHTHTLHIWGTRL